MSVRATKEPGPGGLAETGEPACLPGELPSASGSASPARKATARLRATALRLRDFRGVRALDLALAYLDGSPVDTATFHGGCGAGTSSVLEAVRLATETYAPPPPAGSPPRPAWGEPARAAERPRHLIRFGARACAIELDLDVHRDGAPALLLTAELHIGEEALSFLSLAAATLRWRRPEDIVDLGPVLPALRAAGIAWPPHRRIAYVAGGAGADLLDWTAPLCAEAYRQARYGGLESPGALPQLATLSRFWQALSPERPRVLDVIPARPAGTEAEGAEPEAVVLIAREADRPLPADAADLTRAWALAPDRPELPAVLPVERLGRGELSLLRLGAHLLLRHAPPDLVLLDEPEAHLSPAWQARLLPVLRAQLPQAQILIATHAPAIVDATLDYERFPLGAD